ncbi:RraA family protein [Variovorax sp. LT1R16]|uniref:RraA family protein n=1 Tax=Variovorax sp. LT1R16 TaxID=3443728 RepID=UPI003F467BAE
MNTAPLSPLRPDLIARAGKLAASTLHEAGGRIGVLPHEIRQIIPGKGLAGRACTVQSPPGDNLWLHRAIYEAQPGDVLVVQAPESDAYGYWGEIMSVAAQVRNLSGLIINGCVRDADVLGSIGFPIFARGLCIRGTGKDHGALGFVNQPLRFPLLTVHPGDLVVGDADGLVCIPHAQAETIVTAAEQRTEKEAHIIERLRAGERTLELYQF